jgi:hypothetical protein
MRVAGLLLVLVLLVISTNLAIAEPAPIQFTRFATANGFVVAPGDVTGTWTSPTITPGFPFTRLVASWNADTPGDSRVRIDVQATTDSGETSDWYVLGIWAADDHAISRSSINGQTDALGKIDTDTLYAQAHPFVSYALRVHLERATADDPSPGIRALGASASDFTYAPATATSSPLSTEAIELPVPSLSQELHARQYAHWGGGGEAWCSPTSTEMVIEFWGRGPSADDLAWVDPSYADPSVDFAARSTYDAAYRGTGNWPFNTAYAARFGLNSFVTQLRSLSEAERFVRAGIPLVASIASRPGELDGFLFAGGTSGHLVVIVGFDAAGRPIVNDPAAWSDASVRRVYDRAQFERAWLRGSSGTVYVIYPPEVALPSTPADTTPNW